MTALPQLLRLVLWNAFNIVVTLTSNRPYILMPPPQIFYAQVPPPPPLQHPIKYPFRRSTQLLWNVSNLNIPVSSDWKPLTLPLRQFITTAYTTTTTTPSPLQPLTGSLNDNPVFESIVYGTWKLEPTMIYPKHFKKTVNRQYGGFLGNIASKKSIKTNEPSYTLNTSYNASDAFQEVSTKKSFKNQETQQHNVTKKSQRLQTTIHHQQSFVESSTTGLYSATTSKKLDKQLLKIKASTTATTVNVKEQSEITTIINVKGEPELAPEITTITTTTSLATTPIDIKHVQYKNNTFNIEEMTNAAAIDEASTDNPTTIPILNWPSDFIDGDTEQVTTTTTTTTEKPMKTENISLFIPEQLIEHTSEFLIELKALNVPPSLWPRLPQNISKLGMPYATNNLTEEPALCVPTISQEENQSQPKQIIDVERVYCFPLSDNTTSTQLSFNRNDSLENPTNEIVKSLPSKAYRRRLDNVIFIGTVYLYLCIPFMNSRI